MLLLLMEPPVGITDGPYQGPAQVLLLRFAASCPGFICNDPARNQTTPPGTKRRGAASELFVGQDKHRRSARRPWMGASPLEFYYFQIWLIACQFIHLPVQMGTV